MNLYAHFPFCRRKCAYCALYSRVGVSQSDRDAYVASIAAQLSGSSTIQPFSFSTFQPFNLSTFQPFNLSTFQPFNLSTFQPFNLSTIYFGGGSPALCDLRPLLSTLRLRLSTSTDYEFTVELHPLDVSEERLEMLKAGGVNRISMGVQSFDDKTLAAMGRGYTIDEAVRAFELVKRYFDNAGIDLIVGFPGDPCRFELRRFADFGLRHCSVYSLQNERGLSNVQDDNIVLNEIKRCAHELAELGLERYEISNYAVPGYECRHNLAVWRGEDYVGLGEGACGRVGLNRTRGVKNGGYSTETVSEAEDLKERTIFRLRTREGLDASRFPEWRETLDRFVAEGLLTRSSTVYFLTERGTEVCDAILAEIV